MRRPKAGDVILNKLNLLMQMSIRMEARMAALTDAWLAVKEDIAQLRAKLEEIIAGDASDAELRAEVGAVVEEMKAFDAAHDAEFNPPPPPSE